MIPTQQIPTENAPKTDAQVQSIVAGLTAEQRQSLLKMLSQAMAG